MPTRALSEPASSAPTLLTELLAAGEAALRAAFGALERDLNLSPGKYRLLSVLAQSSGPLSAGTLAQTLNVADATVSIMVRRMLREADPLVRRTPSGLDRRAVQIELTERGAWLVRRARGLVQTGAQDFTAPLSQAEQLLLTGLLAKLRGSRATSED